MRNLRSREQHLARRRDLRQPHFLDDVGALAPDLDLQRDDVVPAADGVGLLFSSISPHAGKVLLNADLEKLVATNDQWIRERTGIRERHIVEKGVASSHMATEAAKTLLANTGTNPADIDLIVVASVTPDMMFPAMACLVQDRIGAKKAWGFDLSAACRR